MSSAPTVPLFGRRYQLVIDTLDGQTITVSSDPFSLLVQGVGVPAGDTPLRFTFEINTAAMQDMWTATFRIYNLNAATTTTLIQQGSTVTLSAGYLNGQNYGMVWKGRVLWVEFTKENVTDHVLTIQSIVGSDLINGMLNMATGPFQTQRQLLTAMVQAANPSATINDPGGMLNATAQLPCPKVFDPVKQPRHYLSDAARKANTWGFPDFAGNVNLLSLTAAPTVAPGASQALANAQAQTDIVLAGPDLIYSTPPPVGFTGQLDPSITYSIIGTPKQTLIADTQWGVAFKVLCDARLLVQAQPLMVKIDASVLIEQAPVSFNAPPPVLSKSGIYAVVAVGHYGDSRGNEWYTEVLALGTTGTSIGFPSSDGKDNRYIQTNQTNPQGGN